MVSSAKRIQIILDTLSSLCLYVFGSRNPTMEMEYRVIVLLPFIENYTLLRIALSCRIVDYNSHFSELVAL